MAEFLSIILCLAMLAGMLMLLELGFRMARRFERARGNEATGIFDTAIFALLGLLLGFAFSGAVDRLNIRRDLIVQEANAISTAYLRVDLLPAADQPAVRQLFKDYLSARLDLYAVIDSGGDPAPGQQRVHDLQQRIWSASVASVSQPAAQYSAEVVLPAINDMIDITTTRKVALDTHLPDLVVALLFGMSLLSAFIAGAGMAKHDQRRTLHGGFFAAAVALTVYTILDLDNPRGGLIRMDAAERVLVQMHM